MADFGPNKAICQNFQIVISQEPLTVISWKFSEFSYLNDT